MTPQNTRKPRASTREVDGLVCAVDALIEIGLTPTNACRKAGLNIYTYYKRKGKDGGVSTTDSPRNVNISDATAQGYANATKPVYPDTTAHQGGVV